MVPKYSTPHSTTTNPDSDPPLMDTHAKIPSIEFPL